MRQFIRHPLNIPIELSCPEEPDSHLDAYSIGVGGLAVHSSQMREPGSFVHIKIPHMDPAFETDARVVWSCPAADNTVEIGLEFLNTDDAYRMRMMEQICHIEEYRQRVNKNGHRNLSTEEAAREWIAKFAARFPPSE